MRTRKGWHQAGCTRWVEQREQPLQNCCRNHSFEPLTLPKRLAKFTQAITGLLKTPRTFSAADAAFEAMQGAELLRIWIAAYTMLGTRVLFLRLRWVSNKSRLSVGLYAKGVRTTRGEEECAKMGSRRP